MHKTLYALCKKANDANKFGKVRPTVGEEMKLLQVMLIAIVALTAFNIAAAKGGIAGVSHSVKAYTTKNGTYVPQHRCNKLRQHEEQQLVPTWEY